MPPEQESVLNQVTIADIVLSAGVYLWFVYLIIDAPSMEPIRKRVEGYPALSPAVSCSFCVSSLVAVCSIFLGQSWKLALSSAALSCLLHNLSGLLAVLGSTFSDGSEKQNPE